MYLMGYELGESHIRLALLRISDRVVVRRMACPLHGMDLSVASIGSEGQWAERWWLAMCQATKSLLRAAKLGPRAIGGIGISFPSETAVFPGVGEGDSAKLGFPAREGANVHNPGLTGQTENFMTAGEYLCYRLTGTRVRKDAAEYKGVWPEDRHSEVAGGGAAASVGRGWPSVTGRLTEQAASETGLPLETPVAYCGIHADSLAAALGFRMEDCRIVREKPRILYASAGWEPGNEAQAPVGAHRPSERAPDRKGRRTGLLVLDYSGLAAFHRWVEQAVFGAVPDRTEWVRQAAAVPVGANGLFAYPPVGCSDATASGNVAHACIQGIDIGRHHRAHLYRAALEGMAFSMAADLLDFERHGIWPEQIRAVRKDGADAMWYGVVSSLLANLTGVPVEVWETDGAVGAALAAGIKMERRSDGDGRNIRAAADYRRERYEPDAFREQVWQAYLDWTTGRAGVESVGQPLDVALELQNREVTDSATDRAGALAAEQLKSVRTVLSGWARTMRHPALKAALAALDEGIAYDGPTFFLRRNGLARWSTAEDPFLQQLEQTVSGLSQQEVMVCQMLRKKLTTKEMATHLNLSLRGVETIRYRLRRKLGIPPGYSLRKYLDEIACGRGPVSEAGTSGDQGDKISG